MTATLGASDWTTWKEGGWPAIAMMSAGVFGVPLAVLVAIAGMVSALALFNALLLSYSRIPFAMALDGLLPSFIALRIHEPGSRGAFRIPTGTSGVCVLAGIPMLILLVVTALSFRDGEYGFPAVIGAGVAVALGPLAYRLFVRPARTL